MLDHGVDVGVVGEEPAVAEPDREKHEPGLEGAEEAELRREPLVGKRGQGRHPAFHGEQGRQARSRRDHEGRAPTHRPGEEARERHAREVRDRHARDHQAHVARGFARARELRADDRPHAEEGAVREPRNEARRDHEAVVGREHRDGVPEHDDGAEDEEEALQGHAPPEERHQHHARANARGVGRDEVSGLRHRHAEIPRRRQQDRHHGKFGDAEREGAERERKDVFGDHGRMKCAVQRNKKGAIYERSHPSVICGRRLS